MEMVSVEGGLPGAIRALSSMDSSGHGSEIENRRASATVTASTTPRRTVLKSGSLKPMPPPPRSMLSFRPLPGELTEWIVAATEGRPYVPTREAAMAAQGAQLPARRRSLPELGVAGVWTTLSPTNRLVNGGGDDGLKCISRADTTNKLVPEREVPCLLALDQGGQVKCVAVSPDGKLVARAGGSSGSLDILCAATGKTLNVLAGQSLGCVNCISFSRDGFVLASGHAEGTIRIWDMALHQEKCTIAGHEKAVNSVCFSRDGKLMASGSSDRTVKIFHVSTGSERHTLRGHTNWVNSVAFSTTGAQTLASASSDKTVKIWDGLLGDLLATLRGHNDSVKCVAFGKKGALIASGSYDMTVKVWDATTGREQCTLYGHGDWVTSVAFCGEGTLLASASYDKTVMVCDSLMNNVQSTLRGHSDRVLSVAFDDRGALLASGGDDGGVRIWDFASVMGDGGQTSPTAKVLDWENQDSLLLKRPCNG